MISSEQSSHLAEGGVLCCHIRVKKANLYELFLERGNLVRLAQVGGDAAELNVGPLQTVPGKRQKRSEFARKPREEVGPANVREKADSRFWHRKDGLFGGDSVLAVNRETDAAAHRDPVNQGDVRNPESSNLPKTSQELSY